MNFPVFTFTLFCFFKLLIFSGLISLEIKEIEQIVDSFLGNDHFIYLQNLNDLYKFLLGLKSDFPTKANFTHLIFLPIIYFPNHTTFIVVVINTILILVNLLIFSKLLFAIFPKSVAQVTFYFAGIFYALDPLSMQWQMQLSKELFIHMGLFLMGYGLTRENKISLLFFFVFGTLLISLNRIYLLILIAPILIFFICSRNKDTYFLLSFFLIVVSLIIFILFHFESLGFHRLHELSWDFKKILESLNSFRTDQIIRNLETDAKLAFSLSPLSPDSDSILNIVLNSMRIFLIYLPWDGLKQSSFGFFVIFSLSFLMLIGKAGLLVKLNSKIALSLLFLAIVFAVYGHVFPNYGSLFRYLYIFNFILFTVGIGCWLQFLSSRFVVFSRFVSSDENRAKVYQVTCFACVLLFGFVRDFLVIEFVLNGSDVLIYANFLLMLLVLQTVVLNPSIYILKDLTVQRAYRFALGYLVVICFWALFLVCLGSVLWGELSPNLTQMLAVVFVSVCGLAVIPHLIVQRRHNFLILGLASYPLVFGAMLFGVSVFSLELVLSHFIFASIGTLLVYCLGISSSIFSIRNSFRWDFYEKSFGGALFRNGLFAYGGNFLVQVIPICFLVISWELSKYIFATPSIVLVLGMKLCFAFLGLTRLLLIVETLDNRFLVLVSNFIRSRGFIFFLLSISLVGLNLEIPGSQMMQEFYFVLGIGLGVAVLTILIENSSIRRFRL